MARGKLKTTNEFIVEASIKHNNQFDYSLVVYKNKTTKVKIICPIHGIFEQRPDNHLMGQGCKKCHDESKLNTLDCFIEKANSLYQKKYDYSNVDYINNQTPVSIICPEHGIFDKTPNTHLSGQGCPLCSMVIKKAKRTKTHNEFLIDANNTHNGLYDYLDEYVKSYEKIKIRCTTCNHIFKQTPRAHLEGKGCPVCKNSVGESKIRQYLLDSNIQFNPEYTFPDCRNIRPLPFDFYLNEINTCIEFDGKQHYEPNKFFGGQKAFIETQKRDKIKTEYCLDKNINLIRIKYDEDITKKLKTMLNQ